MDDKESSVRKELIETAGYLYKRGMAVAKSGNLSARLDDNSILITAYGAPFKDLKEGDIVKIDINNPVSATRQPSSELSLHILIYNNLACKKILHAHPPLTNGYFAVNDSLKPLTFESEIYLGKLTAINQETPTVKDPYPVVEALKKNNIVILKNHGVVSVSDTFEEALALVEVLEEAIMTAAIARIFKEKIS